MKYCSLTHFVVLLCFPVQKFQLIFFFSLLVICILIPFLIMYILDTIKMFKIKSYTDKATIVLEDTTGWKPRHHGVDTTGVETTTPWGGHHRVETTTPWGGHHGVETTTPQGGHHRVETTTPRGGNNNTTTPQGANHDTMGRKPRMETMTPRGTAFPV